MPKRALGIIQNAGLAACIQAPTITFPRVQLSPTNSLWAEAMHCAFDALNFTATTASLGNKSRHEMWYGTAASSSPYPFLRPAYNRWKRPSKLPPWAKTCFYLGPGIDHSIDSSRMLTRENKMVEARDVTWEATREVRAPPPQLPD